MKKITLIVCLYCLPFFSKGQRTNFTITIDSLQKELSKAKTDTDRINLLDLISFNYSNFDSEKGLRYAREAASIALKINWNRGMANAEIDQGLNYMAKNDDASAIAHYLKALEIYRKTGDKKGMGSVYANMGYLYLTRSDYVNALENDFKALRFFEDVNDVARKAIVLENIGTIYLEQKKYAKALEYYSLALEDYKKTGGKQGIARNYGNQGIILNEQGNYALALKYHLLALETNKELGNQKSVKINLANLGITYGYLKNYPLALIYHLKALELSKKNDSKRDIAINLGNAGEVYYLMAKDSTMYKSKLKNLDSAISYLNHSIELCREIHFMGPYMEFSEHLSQAYALYGNHKKALEVYRAGVAVKDSVFSEETKLQIADLEAKRHIDLKNKDIVLRNQQIELAKLQLIKKRNERLVFIICIVLLLIIIFLLQRVFYLSRKKHEQVLSDIAFIQSHVVRAPLARILGLVKLIDKKNLSKENKKVIKYIEQSSDELDAVIKKIVDKSEVHK